MNEDLKKYTDELDLVEKAILQVEGMIHTKEENVQDLQSQLNDLAGKRELIEKAIEEKEKAQENEKNAETEEKDMLNGKTSIESEELEEELSGKTNSSGLKIDNLDKGLMDTMVNTKKARNNSLLMEMKAQAQARAEIAPELEIETKAMGNEEVNKVPKTVEKDDIEI